jgi:hypothetical protein
MLHKSYPNLRISYKYP